MSGARNLRCWSQKRLNRIKKAALPGDDGEICAGKNALPPT